MPNNKDRSILQPRLPIELHRKFYQGANLDGCLNELTFISMDTIKMWLKTKNQILSDKSILTWLLDKQDQNLLVPQDDPSLGAYWKKTAKWAALNSIAHVRLEAQAKIAELKRKGHTS